MYAIFILVTAPVKLNFDPGHGARLDILMIIALLSLNEVFGQSRIVHALFCNISQMIVL